MSSDSDTKVPLAHHSDKHRGGIRPLEPTPQFVGRVTKEQYSVLQAVPAERRGEVESIIFASSLADQKLDWIIDTLRNSWDNQITIEQRMNELEAEQEIIAAAQSRQNNWFKDMNHKKKLALAACVLVLPGLSAKFPDLLGVVWAHITK